MIKIPTTSSSRSRGAWTNGSGWSRRTSSRRGKSRGRPRERVALAGGRRRRDDEGGGSDRRGPRRVVPGERSAPLDARARPALRLRRRPGSGGDDAIGAGRAGLTAMRRGSRCVLLVPPFVDAIVSPTLGAARAFEVASEHL